MPLLSLSHVDFDYGRESLLRDVTLDLEPGEKAALVGVNGSGKSTLLQLIAGTLAPDKGERHLTRRARVVTLPQETAAEGDGTLLEWVKSAHEVEIIAREIEVLHRRLDDGEVLDADELERYGALQHRFETLGGYKHQSQVESTLHGLGFAGGDFDKPIRVLSGGERRRAALAATLLQHGELVLLDEPTNHLDLDALEWLQEFVRASDSAMLIVSHDRYFLDHVVTGVWHLANSRGTYWPGNYSQFAAAFGGAVEQQEKQWERQQDEIRRTEDFIRRNIAGQKTKQAKSRRKMLDRMERVERLRDEKTRFRLRLHTARRGGNIVLDAKELSQRFGARTLFERLDLQLVKGDKVGIVGPNGAGKSTLLRILAGRTPAQTGAVRLGSDIDLGYFDQELDIAGDAPTLLEEIWRMDRRQSEESVRACLGAFGFGADYIERPVRVLSGGQRNRLGLLKLMLMQRNFLVLDEPTNHLDLDSVAVLEDALREFDGTLLMVSHDRQLLSRAVSKLLIVAGGHWRLFHGGYEEYVQSLGGAPLWGEIAAFEAERAAKQVALEARLASANRVAAVAGADAGGAGDGGAAAAPSKNALAKLRKQIDALETEIATLEVDLEELEHQLARAHALRPEEIATASRRHADTQGTLRERYAAWDALTEDLEAKQVAARRGGK
jgi:ATP-binding cassette subfamily F protein 3